MKRLLFLLLACLTPLSSAEFSIASYNCGGLPDHYDYIRTFGTQNLSQKRAQKEPEQVTRFQHLASQALADPESLSSDDRDFLNSFLSDTSWYEESTRLMTTYRERPVVIHDSKISTLFLDTIADLTRGEPCQDPIDSARRNLAKRIFSHHVTQEIICLQEANYLDASLFPSKYAVHISSAIGMAWDTTRFELIEIVPTTNKRALIVKLQDIASAKTVLVASAHLSGCDPFYGGEDSAQGDTQLKTVLEALSSAEADEKLIAMDSNVTAMHPRLAVLKEAGYRLDTKNFLEPTCTHPTTLVDTRIDWIAIQSKVSEIVNIPIQGVGLNSPQTNISDHKPIAAKIISW